MNIKNIIRTENWHLIIVSNRLTSFFSLVIVLSLQRLNGISLGQVIFLRSKKYDIPQYLNHEKIHSRQWFELCYLIFLMIYLLEYFHYRLIKGYSHMESYMLVSFEQEAHLHEDDTKYLSSRNMHAWCSYLRWEDKKVLSKDGMVFDPKDIADQTHWCYQYLACLQMLYKS